MVELTCEECGGGFLVKPYRTATARFCSAKCKGTWIARERLNKRPRPLFVEIPESRRCTKCGETKLLAEFYRHKAGKFGRRPDCKKCRALVEALRRVMDPGVLERSAARGRARYPSVAKEKAEYLRSWRDKNRAAARAHSMVNNRIKRGTMKKPTECEVCDDGSKTLCAHHHDYSKPLDVVWVCPLCHGGIHSS